MQHSPIQEQIAPIIESSMQAMGYRLVRVQWQGSDKRKVLQIMAEPQEDRDMTVEDCTEISHMVSALLDVEDPIESAYELEVSSPGIDRPLMSAEDFQAYQGHEVKIEMAVAQAGRRRYRGNIDVVTEGLLSLVNGGEHFELPIADMASAKLVLTDKLVKESLKRSEDRQREQVNEQ